MAFVFKNIISNSNKDLKMIKENFKYQINEF